MTPCKHCGYEPYTHPEAVPKATILSASEMNDLVAAIRPLVFSIVIEAMSNVYRTHVAALDNYGPKETL
jgi:hypothetical protein